MWVMVLLFLLPPCPAPGPGQGAGPWPSTMLLESYRNWSFSFLDGSSFFLNRSFFFLDGSSTTLDDDKTTKLFAWISRAFAGDQRYIFEIRASWIGIATTPVPKQRHIKCIGMRYGTKESWKPNHRCKLIFEWKWRLLRSLDSFLVSRDFPLNIPHN